jgi:hypothetical protein
MSFDFFVNSAHASNTDARYELVNSGANVDDGADTVQISVRSNWGSLGLRIQLGENVDAGNFAFKELDGIMKLDAWNTFTLIVDRNATSVSSGNETVKVHLYLNGELVKTNTITKIAYGQVLGNGVIRLGGGTQYTDTSKTLKMDNFLLCDGILTEQQITDIALSTKLL